MLYFHLLAAELVLETTKAAANCLFIFPAVPDCWGKPGGGPRPSGACPAGPWPRCKGGTHHLIAASTHSQQPLPPAACSHPAGVWGPHPAALQRQQLTVSGGESSSTSKSLIQRAGLLKESVFDRLSVETFYDFMTDSVSIRSYVWRHCWET